MSYEPITTLEDLDDLSRAYWRSRIVISALELDAFTAVGEDGGTASEVAVRLGADPRATEMLLNALTALALLRKEADRFRLGELAARHLIAGAAEDARPSFMHASRLWESWSTLTDCVRAGGAVLEGGKGWEDPGGRRAFIGAMHQFALEQSDAFVEAVDLSGVRRLLDLGGGSGAYAIRFSQAAPGLEATVFDQAAIIELTEEYIAAAGLTGSIRTLRGDMLMDDIGSGYDLVWLSNVVHGMGAEGIRGLFCKVHGALAPGGRLLLRDFLLDDDKASPAFGAVFALNMLVNTPAGSCYSRAEYREWLTAAGFDEPEDLPVQGGGNTAVLSARRA